MDQRLHRSRHPAGHCRENKRLPRTVPMATHGNTSTGTTCAMPAVELSTNRRWTTTRTPANADTASCCLESLQTHNSDRPPSFTRLGYERYFPPHTANHARTASAHTNSVALGTAGTSESAVATWKHRHDWPKHITSNTSCLSGVPTTYLHVCLSTSTPKQTCSTLEAKFRTYSRESPSST